MPADPPSPADPPMPAGASVPPRWMRVVDWTAFVFVLALLLTSVATLVYGAWRGKFVHVHFHTLVEFVACCGFLWAVIRGRKRRSPFVYWITIFVLLFGACFAFVYAARAGQEERFGLAGSLGALALLLASLSVALGYELALGRGRRFVE